MTPEDRNALRRAYLMFCAGAGLRQDDAARLLHPLGLSNNRIRELGRDSDRGLPITPQILEALMRAWSAEQRAPAADHQDERPG